MRLFTQQGRHTADAHHLLADRRGIHRPIERRLPRSATGQVGAQTVSLVDEEMRSVQLQAVLRDRQRPAAARAAQ
ncbi:hypothetical protein CAI21_10115 [Alkalilimnicola ehrlichii]|uniref:hypothetical protein n=1 Tax=Alkalilimnicola ehrlichii TaxID=351052 RepID=UPI000E2E8253|nr:hypothetical protein [Alkalilimnicola ehrlichii]RFA29405.1 hypothetical protein CAI21_10115 [Alkalilimnicola ehrlichii]